MSARGQLHVFMFYPDKEPYITTVLSFFLTSVNFRFPISFFDRLPAFQNYAISYKCQVENIVLITHREPKCRKCLTCLRICRIFPRKRIESPKVRR